MVECKINSLFLFIWYKLKDNVKVWRICILIERGVIYSKGYLGRLN